MGGHEQHTAQLPVGPGPRLEGGRFKAGYLGQEKLKLMEKPKFPLDRLGRQEGVGLDEAGQVGQSVVNFWVVFHGATTQWVGAGVDPEIP
jgi:hypothetical protein